MIQEEIILKIREIENVCNNLPSIPWNGPDHQVYYDLCVPHVSLDGLWLEFGVFKAKTISYLATKTQREFFGFDSFEGLQEHWDDENPKFAYTCNGIIPTEYPVGKPLPSNITLIKGFFEDTLPSFADEHKEQIAFIHIDSDLYSSCKTIFEYLGNQIVENTVICFDDFMDWDYNQNNEIRAFAEFLIERNLNYQILVKFRSPGCNYFQVCFKITK
jgi:hypothetical protein